MQESILWTTNGVGDGAADITRAQWIDFFRMLFLRDYTTQGVAPGFLNALAVSSTGNNNVRVGSGGGVVRGFLYQNTANVDHTINSPVADTGFRVVLRADWDAQTVRQAVVMNTTGVTDPPALTQSELDTWEISLATGTITSGGVIAVTSAPTYLYYNTKVSTTMLDNAAVTADKLAAAVAGNGLAGGAGSALSVTVDDATIEINADTVRVKNLGITTAKINDLAVTTGKLADDAVETDKIADDAVTKDKLANVYIDLVSRQGGDSSNWSTGGITNYHPATASRQMGAGEFSIDAGNDFGGAVITFDAVFDGVPHVLHSVGKCHVTGNATAYKAATTLIIARNASSFTVRAYRRDPADNADAWTVLVEWTATHEGTV